MNVSATLCDHWLIAGGLDLQHTLLVLCPGVVLHFTIVYKLNSVEQRMLLQLDT